MRVGDDPTAGAARTDAREGSRFVIQLYVALVAVAATAGLLTGAFVDGLSAPRFLFLVPLPPTPLGFAVYGGLTVALVLGIPLALVRYVSQNIDDVEGQ
ncbi:DUF7520 family protein [Halobellus rubicundus]|uniref:Cox cluster protein n=1 Tax=Halobellus rubicundus TaxID=2996466 RepID=A0ABD5ME04_9EURY